MSQIAKEMRRAVIDCLESEGEVYYDDAGLIAVDTIIDHHLAGLYERQAEALAIRFVTKALIMDDPFDGGPKYECSLLIEADDIEMARDQATHQLTAALREAGEEG